jgi:hypothetical protein
MIVEHFRLANISANEITYERLRSSIASIRVFYESMDVLYVQSEPTRLFLDFISGVGGIWGLFVGI